MKDYFNKSFYDVKLKNAKAVDFVVENMHFFGDYEAAKDGEVVVNTLVADGLPIYSLTSDDEYSIIELASFALDWASSDSADYIIANFEVARDWIVEAEKDSEIKNSVQYAESKKIFENLKEDYNKIVKIKGIVPYLNQVIEDELNNEQKARDVVYDGYMSVLDRDNFKSQFRFIYEKEPTEKQLDAFIDFMTGKETDVEKVRRICDGASEIKQPNK